MRNRALPAVMAFVAQAVGRRVLCYATANFLRDEAENMVPRFADYWKNLTVTDFGGSSPSDPRKAALSTGSRSCATLCLPLL